MKRHIVQITSSPETADRYAAIYALADDGTLWRAVEDGAELLHWESIPALPDSQEAKP